MADDYIYHTIYVQILSVLFILKLLFGKIELSQEKERNAKMFIWLLVIWAIIFIAYRPITEETGDTQNYARYFENIDTTSIQLFSADSFFYGSMKVMSSLHFDVYAFFLLVAIIYVGSHAYFSYKFFKSNAYLIFFSVLISFSFFGYGINGIRNGLAISMFLIAFSFWEDKKYKYFLLFSFLSVFIHSSVLLPIAALLATRYIKKMNIIFKIWLLCLALSLVFGNQIEAYINGLQTFTSREEDYFSMGGTDKQFAMGGFRWDFLLYSAVPIFISYYYIIKRKINNDFYNTLTCVYVLCNSFWLFMASSWLSNRYAYLSWFLYVFVLFYPFLYFEKGPQRVWRTTLAFIGNYGFTLLMFFLEKFR